MPVQTLRTVWLICGALQLAVPCTSWRAALTEQPGSANRQRVFRGVAVGIRALPSLQETVACSSLCGECSAWRGERERRASQP